LNIGFCEIVSLEQEREAGRLGKGIRKTVAKIQGGGMTALAILPEGESISNRGLGRAEALST